MRVVGALVYLAAAVATGNWIEYAFHFKMSHYYLYLPAAFGAATLTATAFLLSFGSRYWKVMGATGIILSWPYFGWLAARIAIRGEVTWIAQTRYLGREQLYAIAALAAATIIFFLQVVRGTEKNMPPSNRLMA